MAQTVTRRGHLQLIDITDMPPERGVRELVAYAVRLKASDLFFLTNEQHVAVNVRYLGLIEPISILDREHGQRYLAHIRAEIGMDLTDYRRPADGRWMYDIDDEQQIDLRISAVPTLYGEDMAIRLLVRDTALLSIDKLGMTPSQQDAYRNMLERTGGLIVLTGPTGSGKTVTMYSALTYLNNGARKIHTIEDPIEYAIDGLRQSQVNPTLELGPAELLRGVLRQSPDAIMVGEVRDAQTADAAVWAANSGVLVLTTVHAPSVEGAIQSLRGFGVPAAFISTSVRGVISTRLLRTLCPDCRQLMNENDGASMDEVVRYLEPGQPTMRYAARGCEKCYNTGYSGRVGIFEVVPVSEPLREMILKGRSSRQIREQTVSEGTMTLRQSAVLKAACGLTSMDEVKRTIPPDVVKPTMGRKSLTLTASERLTQAAASV